jgi:cyanophycin synthetase
VAAGFQVAREHSRSVIVETFVTGDDHRLLVVNGELVAATRRTPGHVVGDGVLHGRAAGRAGEPGPAPRRRPREGADPPGHRRAGAGDAGPSPATTRTRCRREDERVFLRSTANLSTGGTATDVTDIIHP